MIGVLKKNLRLHEFKKKIIRLKKEIIQKHKFYGYYAITYEMKSKLVSRPTETKVKPPSIPRSLLLRTKTSDIPTYHQVFTNREYEVKLSKEPKVIIDCGAYTGFSAIYFTVRYPEAKVLAIEPELSNFTLLKKNSLSYPKIIPIRAALWNDNQDIEIIDPGLGHWGYQTQTCKNHPDTLVGYVQGITVDKIISNYAIDFIDILKIDIEGAEKEVFKDVSKWIDKVGVIMVEHHDRLKPGCSQSVYNAIIEFDYEFHKGENIFFARKEYVPNEPLNTSWFFRRAQKSSG